MIRLSGFVIALLLVSVSCKTISYQNARHSNEDKFYGEKEAGAILLVELMDRSQLVEDLSGIAEDKVYSKDLYDFASNAEKDHKKFQFSMEFLALKKGIKLPDATSSKNQDIYRELLRINDKKAFDTRYMAEMETLLDSMTIKSDDYMGEGEDNQIRKFISKHTGMFKSQLKRIEGMQVYIEETTKTKKELSVIED